jgi:hypothetical protein
MRQNERDAANGLPRSGGRGDIVMAWKGVIYAEDRQWTPSEGFVPEHSNAGSNKSGTNSIWRGPMIMIAKNRNHTKRRIEVRQRCFQTSCSLGCTGGVMADNKISG